MAEHILLSISMLASRKKEQVKRCLDSLRPITDALPCELILVDTSKDAAVHEMLLSYTEQVVEFDWCQDFAKARNTGLALAKGEWFLYIDDDEWFEDVDELIRFFQSGEYKKYGCANYIQRNYHDPRLVHYSDAWASRMIRLGKETHFRSKIHEYLYPQEGNCKNLHVIAGHTGYIYQTDDDRQKPFERNYPLLLDMMKEEPERLRWRVQIAQELYTVHRWADLLTFCVESLEFAVDRNDEWDSRDIGTFYAGAVESAVNLKQYEVAEHISGQMREDARASELCHAYVALLEAQANYRQRQWEKAQEYIEEYYRQKQFLEQHRTKLEIQQGALLVEAAFDSIPVKRALSMEMGCRLMQGDTSVLRDRFEELEWEQPVIYVSDDFFPTLVEAMAILPPEPVFVRAMQCLWDNGEMQKRMFAIVQGWEAKDEEGFHRLLRLTAQLEGSHWYIWYAKILVAGMDDKPDHLAEDFREFCRNTPDIFMTPGNVMRILRKYKVSIADGYRSVPFEQWDEQLKAYIAKVPLMDLLLTEQELMEMQNGESTHFSYALMRFAEARVLHSVDQEKYATKWTCFMDFTERACAFARCYYRPEVIENYPELLPEYMQAALLLEKAFAFESADMPRAAELQRRAAEVYPTIAPAVCSFMQATSKERERRDRDAKEELRNLEKQVKKQVEQCIEAKQYADALSILAQLKELCPNDLETAELTLKARLGTLESAGET